MPFIQSARGGRLHYAERGEPRSDAAPALLVHGAGASSAIWMMVMARLARAARAVAIDLPGHGPSPLPEAGVAALGLEAYRDAVGLLAGTLCLGPSLLVGHSMGALVALEAALAWPDKVRGLVLCAAAPRLPVRDELLALLRDGPARVPAWRAERALSPRARPAVRRGFVAAGLVAPPEVMLADFEAVRAADLRERVGGVKCPVLWLDGADDALVGAAGERPGEVRRLEAVGHLVPIEAPEAVAAGVAHLRASTR
ncbi:MAG TPA: alpha/beta hydrolase [Polyangia bacterium]|nr:alpha/beta hydrolase [Polyangia bacterium]